MYLVLQPMRYASEWVCPLARNVLAYWEAAFKYLTSEQGNLLATKFPKGPRFRFQISDFRALIFLALVVGR